MSDAQRAASARRMRIHRQRQREGIFAVIRIPMRVDDIDALIHAGLLPDAEVYADEEIAEAISKLLLQLRARGHA